MWKSLFIYNNSFFMLRYLKILKSFFFFFIYPLRIMQLLLFLHECLSFASLSAVPHVSSIILKSPWKVFFRDIFGLPCFLLPGGFYLKPFLGILFCSYIYLYKYVEEKNSQADCRTEWADRRTYKVILNYRVARY